LFAIFDAILPADVQRIVEYKFGRLKTDTMLALVALVFGVIL